MEPFRYRHRVTYADCTVGNHIYYGRYLEILEAARGEWFRALGKSFDDWHHGQGLIFPVLEVRLNYRSPARYDEMLLVEVGVKEARGVRFNVAYRVLGADGRVCVEGDTHHVCTNVEDKPRRLPAELISALGVPAGGLRSPEL
jgi:acyl-CoA thioester hydrolase